MRALVAMVVLLVLPAEARWRPEFAQMTPELRQWYKDQKNPSTSVPCCDESDGAHAFERWTGDHFQAKFTWREADGTAHATGWLDVPTEAVLKGPNPNGYAVVWYAVSGSAPAGVLIRCYMPERKDG